MEDPENLCNLGTVRDHGLCGSRTHVGSESGFVPGAIENEHRRDAKTRRVNHEISVEPHPHLATGVVFSNPRDVDISRSLGSALLVQYPPPPGRMPDV
jgi:hypothetical protein